MYKDFDSLFEKFSILTTDGQMTDAKAFKYLQNKTTPELYNKLVNKVREITIG